MVVVADTQLVEAEATQVIGAGCYDGRHLPGEPQAASSDDSSGLLTSARIRWLMVRMVPKVSH